MNENFKKLFCWRNCLIYSHQLFFTRTICSTDFLKSHPASLQNSGKYCVILTQTTKFMPRNPYLLPEEVTIARFLASQQADVLCSVSTALKFKLQRGSTGCFNINYFRSIHCYQKKLCFKLLSEVAYLCSAAAKYHGNELQGLQCSGRIINPQKLPPHTNTLKMFTGPIK